MKTAKVLMTLAPESLSLELVSIAELPMLNEDLEETPPHEWEEFREKIKAADGLLFLTPEYNRLVPVVLKNALEVCIIGDINGRTEFAYIWSLPIFLDDY